jgi:hypothetical protein
LVAHQVDLLIEAYYHLDEDVKGEFLGIQMSKVGVMLLLSLLHAHSKAQLSLRVFVETFKI